MRAARAGLIVVSVALAAGACGGGRVTPTNIATPVATVAPAPAAPTDAPPTDAPPTDAPASDAPTSADAPASDPAPSDTSADSPTDTPDSATAGGPVDPTLITGTDVPAGFTPTAPQIDTVGTPGVCNVVSDAHPGRLSVSSVAFILGSGDQTQEIQEEVSTYPDAASAQARLAKGLADSGCMSFDEPGGIHDEVTLSPQGPTMALITVDRTSATQHQVFSENGFTKGAKLYSLAVVVPYPVNTTLLGDINFAAQQKAGY